MMDHKAELTIHHMRARGGLEDPLHKLELFSRQERTNQEFNFLGALEG